MRPGARLFTRMFSGPSSIDSSLLNMRSAALQALPGVCRGTACLRGARDVDDDPAPALPHVGDDRLSAADVAQKLAVDRVHEGLVRQIDEGSEGRGAGVVD